MVPTAGKSRSHGGSERGTYLPDDWEPSPLARAFGIGLLGAERAASEIAGFRDWWRAKAGADGRKRDWDATWRGWVRTSDRRGRDPPGRSKHGLAAVVRRLHGLTSEGFYSDHGNSPPDYDQSRPPHDGPAIDLQLAPAAKPMVV